MVTLGCGSYYRVAMIALLRWLSHYCLFFKYPLTLVETPHLLPHCSLLQVQKKHRKAHGSPSLSFPFSFFFLFLLFFLLFLFLSCRSWLLLPEPRPKPLVVPSWTRRTQQPLWRRPWWRRRRQTVTPIVIPTLSLPVQVLPRGSWLAQHLTHGMKVGSCSHLSRQMRDSHQQVGSGW